MNLMRRAIYVECEAKECLHWDNGCAVRTYCFISISRSGTCLDYTRIIDEEKDVLLGEKE